MIKERTIKTKIIEYIANEAFAELQNALGEVDGLLRQPAFYDRNEGAGLDLMVLKEKLIKAIKLTELLR